MAPSVKLGKVSEVEYTPIGPVGQVGNEVIDRTGDAEWLDRQRKLAGALEAQMRGEGPSLAKDTLDQATDRNLKQSFALARSGRGQAGIGLRAAQIQGAEGAQAAAKSAAMIRSNEQLDAQKQLGGLTATARETERGYATDQANLNQKTGLFNTEQSNLRQTQEAENRYNTSSFNANARNQRMLTQAELNTRLKVADMTTRAQIQAAGIAASAQKYSANLSFIQGQARLGFDMDKFYLGEASSTNRTNYKIDTLNNQAGSQSYKQTVDAMSQVASNAAQLGAKEPKTDEMEAF